MAHRLKLIPKMWGGGKAKINKGLDDLVTDILNEAATRSQLQRDAAAQERQERAQRQFISNVNRAFGIDNNSRPTISYGRYRGLTILLFPNNNSKGIIYVILDTSGVLPDKSIKISERGTPKYTVVYANGSTRSSLGRVGIGLDPTMDERIWGYLFNLATIDHPTPALLGRPIYGGELSELRVVGERFGKDHVPTIDRSDDWE